MKGLIVTPLPLSLSFSLSLGERKIICFFYHWLLDEDAYLEILPFTADLFRCKAPKTKRKSLYKRNTKNNICDMYRKFGCNNLSIRGLGGSNVRSLFLNSYRKLVKVCL